MEVKSDNKGPAAWIGDRHARNKTLYFISQFYPHWYWVLWLFVNTMRSQGVCTEIRYFHCHQDIRYYVCFTNGSEKSSSCNGPACALIFVQFDKFTAQCDTSGRYSSFIKKSAKNGKTGLSQLYARGSQVGLVSSGKLSGASQIRISPLQLCQLHYVSQVALSYQSCIGIQEKLYSRERGRCCVRL